MKQMIVGLGLLALGACATAPEVYEVQRTRVIDAPMDRVWSRSVEFFATSNLAIRTLEKDSGIIAAERMIGSPQVDGRIGSWASCGSGFLEIPIAQSVDMNVFVQPVTETTTRVSVNARFTETRRFDYTTTQVECNSTGALERSILDYIEAVD